MSDDPSHRESYDHAMAEAAAIYGDVLNALRLAGYVAEMTQTGGMCLAIEIDMGGDESALVTDRNEILPWDRADHEGWGIDMYVGAEADQPTVTIDCDDSSPAGLLSALGQIGPG